MTPQIHYSGKFEKDVYEYENVEGMTAKNNFCINTSVCHEGESLLFVNVN